MKGAEQMKKQEGITLIALVITIIILIILAGITISAVFGENGLILRAREAAFKTEVGVIKDQVEIGKIQIGSSGEFSTNGTVNLANIIPDNQKTKYYAGGSKLGIAKGKLGYYGVAQSEGGFSDTEKQWLEDIGIHIIEAAGGIGQLQPFERIVADISDDQDESIILSYETTRRNNN